MMFLGHVQLLQDVNSMLEQLNQQTTRLKEIRTNKTKQPGTNAISLIYLK